MEEKYRRVRTLLILKPDAVEKDLEGIIVHELTAAGLKVVARKTIQLTIGLLASHYEHQIRKPFFDQICEYMRRFPIVAMVIEGFDAINKLRMLAGHTDPREAEPATFRGRWGTVNEANDRFENVVHASGNMREAAEEIARFFPEFVVYGYVDTT